MTTYEMLNNVPRNSIAAPALPPKPIHLTSAFTGTLDPEALRLYIRQQSIHNLKARSQIDEVPMKPAMDLEDSALTITKLKIRIDDDEEEEDEGDLNWGTARQSPPMQTPTKPAYIKLETLFHPDQVISTSSSMTERPKYTHRSQSSQAEERYDSAPLHPFASLKLPRRKKKGQASSPVTPQDLQSSPFTSESDIQRSREPSIVSRISDWPIDEGDTLDAPTRKWLVVKDGSSFEHAGPGSVLIAPPATKLSIDNQSTYLVAGPPPLRPLSRAVDCLPTQLEAPSNKEESCPHEHEECQNSKPASILSRSSREISDKRRARALYSFAGEASFNELTLTAGQLFDIVKEDIGGGWSLAEIDEKKGLVPHGWYTYVQEFTSSPILSAQAKATGTTSQFANTEEPQSAPMITTKSLLLSPPPQSATSMIRSKSNGGNILSPSEALEQQKRWDRTRPASALGQVYSGIPQSGSAIEALTHMHRAGSGSGTSTTLPRSAGLPTLVASSLSEVSSEEVNNSISTSGSEGLVISTAITTPAVDDHQAEAKPTAYFLSTWKPAALLGGRILNRFAPFVTSGAEDFILRSPLCSVQDVAEVAKVEIASGQYGGPCWKHPGINISIQVQCPEVHMNDSGQEYVAYKVFSSYVLVNEGEAKQYDPHARIEDVSMTSSVYRRFKQFRWLYTYLVKMYPILMMSMPVFPDASYTAGKKARLDLRSAEQRRRHLQSWLMQIVRHPVLCNDAAIRFFLDCEEVEEDWSMAAQVVLEDQHMKRDTSNSLLYRISHPHFNVDAADAALEGNQLQHFNQAFMRGLSTAEVGVLSTFQAMRQTASTSSDSYRQMSYALLRLITGTDGSKGSMQGSFALLDDQVNLPPMGNIGRRDSSGATNEERAWCWREGCKECKGMTRSIQCTAEALQKVADRYEKHSNNALYDLHDRLANIARGATGQNGLMDTHKSTLEMYHQATQEAPDLNKVDDQLGSRCENVLNVTMSEMDQIHTERVQDWSSMNKEMINIQIQFYEDILITLKQARDDNALRDQGQDDIVESEGALLPSHYQMHLKAPIRAQPILQPQDPSSSLSYFGIW